MEVLFIETILSQGPISLAAPPAVGFFGAGSGICEDQPMEASHIKAFFSHSG